MVQQLNTATKQQQNQLLHLTHLLDVQVRIKQRMQVRFGRLHQSSGPSTAQQAGEITEDVGLTQQSS
jgi:hypothetical protein